MMKKLLFWLLAILITMSAAVYQRMTGPTYPARLTVDLHGKEYKIKLPRSHGGTTDCPVILVVADTSIQAVIQYKRFGTSDPLSLLPFKRQQDSLVAALPNQPPAGKLEYHIQFTEGSSGTPVFTSDPVVIRYKGDVPAWVLIPHIFFMFFAMLFANLSGVMAVWKAPEYRRNATIALVLLFIGGMILGPLVQKFAFDAYWTGIPFGYDLTDNKTLFGLIFWVIAWVGNLKKERPWLTILAAIAILVVFSIPHSVRGSQLNYASGQIQTGWILFF